MSALRDRIISCKELTEFQKKVYLELLTVPSGQTISYSELARRIGCRSPQAVGQALKKNPFAPDVPCHRVIRSDGKLGGYFGKTDGEMTERKRKLLEAEAQEMGERLISQWVGTTFTRSDRSVDGSTYLTSGVDFSNTVKHVERVEYWQDGEGRTWVLLRVSENNKDIE